MNESWELLLGALEEQLPRLRESVADDTRLLDLPSTAWVPPTGMGEMSQHLAERASALVEEMESLKGILKARSDETARQLRAIESVPRELQSTAVYLDSIG